MRTHSCLHKAEQENQAESNEDFEASEMIAMEPMEGM